jgi:hypothetical protein
MAPSCVSGVVPASEQSKWRDLVVRAGAPDVYFLPEYVSFFERWGEGQALLFFYTEDRSILLYPFLRRPLPEFDGSKKATPSEARCDVSTAYGYGGPLVSANTEPLEFANRARVSLDRAFEQMGVVSEFIRFHPLLENQSVWERVPTVFNRKTIAIDLRHSADELWRSMNSNTRRKVRQSLKQDLEVQISRSTETYLAFWSLYDKTMERVEANVRYRFSAEYIMSFAEALGDRAVVCSVKHRGRTAAAGIFLVSERFLHYHLGGSDEELFYCRPNDRMFFEMMQWGRAQGAQALHLGGGLEPDDSLLRFKSGFSKQTRDFFVGQVIHDEDAYAVLTEGRVRTGTTPPAPGFFPAYRA